MRGMDDCLRLHMGIVQLAIDMLDLRYVPYSSTSIVEQETLLHSE